MRKFNYKTESFRNLAGLATFLNEKQISIENIVQIIFNSNNIYSHEILYLERIGK